MSLRVRSGAARARGARKSPDDLFDPDDDAGAPPDDQLEGSAAVCASNYSENTYYTADLQWRNIRVRNAGVRSRGSASRNGDKLGLRVDFDRYVTGQRFLGLKSIVLKNLWQDGSFMHEALAMAFFARMGQPAPRAVVLPPLHQQRVPGSLRHRRVGRQRFPRSHPRRERRLPLLVSDAGTVSRRVPRR